MNEYLNGFILGLVQGITEFLPVSSSGHLTLLEHLGVGTPDLLTNLMLHISTLLAVVIVYRKKVWYLIRHAPDPQARFILLACIPTGIIAAIVRYLVPDSVYSLPFCFMATAAILLLPKIIKPVAKPLEEKFTLKAILVGIAQGVACFNGISRSGTTITALRLCGVDGEESAELSFLLSIPVIIASGVVEILTSEEKLIVNGGMIIGMITSFIVGILAIKLFIKILKKDKTAVFSIHTTIMGILSFILIFM